jgi:hypothetical protein
MKTGYDLGGAEYPYDSEHLTVVDILSPDPEHGHVDYYLRDLNNPNWNTDLERRENVYIGKTLRYLDRDRDKQFAAEIDQVVDVGGRIELFDWMNVIEPIMSELICSGDVGYEIFSIELINGPFDNKPGEYNVILMKR